MSRSLPCLALVVALAASLASAASAPADGPVASASKACSIGNSRDYGTTYVLSIRASGTSCRSARRLVRRFHACRRGKTGHCSGVAGYGCSERRFNKSRQSYDSRVRCSKGGRTVKHTYTQWL